MEKRKAYDGLIQFRYHRYRIVEFYNWCRERRRQPLEFLREMVDAAIENRLTIKPSKSQKKIRGVYK